MRNTYLYSLVRIIVVVLIAAAAGCKSGAELNSGALIQKRKYTKGYHVNARFLDKQRKTTFADDHSDAGRSATMISSPEPVIYSERSVDIAVVSTALQGTAPYLEASSNSIPTVLPPSETDRVFMPGAFRGKGGLAFNAPQNEYQTQKEIPGLAIAGFITGIVGLFFAGIILGILSIIFGAVALSKISKQPDLYAGRGFAIVALVLGIISLFGALLVLSTL